MSLIKQEGFLNEKKAIYLKIPDTSEVEWISARFFDRVTGNVYFSSEFRYDEKKNTLYPQGSMVVEGDRYVLQIRLFQVLEIG